MAFMEWDDRFIVGIPELDEHHRQLIDMINQLYDGVLECESLEEEYSLSKEILDKLVGYGLMHFRAEEKLMEQCGYSEIALHRDAHDQFMHEVGRILDRHAQGHAALSGELFGFLKEWITHHILQMDQRYAPVLRQCQEG